MEDPAPQITGAAREAVTGCPRHRRLPALDGVLSTRIQLLIRVEAQNPIVMRLLARKILLRGKSGPGVLDHTRAQARGNLSRLVRRTAIHHNDVVRKRY